MCGRYTVLTEDEIIKIRGIIQELSLRLARDDFRQYESAGSEVRPTDRAPVITTCGDGVSFESLKWGFGKWDGSGVIINARSETLTTKKMFSGLTDAGRCVVPAGAFFEWNRRGKKKKHSVKDRAGSLLFMAGLYRDTDGGREFVIITKDSIGDLAALHDRAPVILRVEQIEDWLNGTLTTEDIQRLEFDLSVAPCDDGKPEAPDDGQMSLFE